MSASISIEDRVRVHLNGMYVADGIVEAIDGVPANAKCHFEPCIVGT